VEGRLLIHRGFTGHACRPHEKSGLIGLLDVLGHPEPYDNLQNLEEDGALKMVLWG